MPGGLGTFESEPGYGCEPVNRPSTSVLLLYCRVLACITKGQRDSCGIPAELGVYSYVSDLLAISSWYCRRCTLPLSIFRTRHHLITAISSHALYQCRRECSVLQILLVILVSPPIPTIGPLRVPYLDVSDRAHTPAFFVPFDRPNHAIWVYVECLRRDPPSLTLPRPLDASLFG